MKLNRSQYNELLNTTDCINALCEQKPMMVINTKCGTGKYRFNKLGYKDGGLLMEFTLTSLIENITYNQSNIFLVYFKEYPWQLEYGRLP